MSNVLVRRALETVLNTWANAQTPIVQVAWENTRFQTPIVRHIRTHMLPGRTTQSTLEGRHRSFTGIFQVSIFEPTGNGPGAALALCDSLDLVYSPSTPIVIGGLTIFIVTPVTAGPAQQETEWHVCPMSFTYRADTYV